MHMGRQKTEPVFVAYKIQRWDAAGDEDKWCRRKGAKRNEDFL